MTYPIIFLGLLLLCLLIIWRHMRQQRDIQQITRITTEVRSGNLTRRYRQQTTSKTLMLLGEELNRLMDVIQESKERTTHLEEERKRMIANISHDLRTPLTSLLGYMEAIQLDADLSAEERDVFLRVAVNKGDDLLALLQDFFELARLESDHSEPELRTLDVTVLIPEVLVDFYPDFVKANVTPLLDIPERPINVRADIAFFRRILNNLLSNSLRYGTDGGEVGIRVCEQSYTIMVEVWDKGKGIAAQDLPHVFERLYTGEASRNNSIRGAGLGLTIVKNLVERMGGRITVSSTPGEKTIFTFHLMKS
ncbi:cell wall metabolism sensor histidine kinase WalK [Paenibacillus sp. UNC496MF]|uniref:sensor histidine kinase n=1 Tax=Paenibacillus sp. UNC496MF TaxID=1502753 RepID=UPI000B858785|nr:HAMP domain-containing sensor histidine kinase [Paenibacillus sp. UNC496MF]